jgi:hypothetical protein
VKPSAERSVPAVTGAYPFGEPLRPVVQCDRTPKQFFVLGVYASAVHARWLDGDGKLLIRALAVASEPVIFWDGTDAEQIIARITLPDGVGTLEAAAQSMNGPSGRALDEHSRFVHGARWRASAQKVEFEPAPRARPILDYGFCGALCRSTSCSS